MTRAQNRRFVRRGLCMLVLTAASICVLSSDASSDVRPAFAGSAIEPIVEWALFFMLVATMFLLGLLGFGPHFIRILSR